jgi:predicted AAA+ superfamily ATPase
MDKKTHAAYVRRSLEAEIRSSLRHYPVTALVGPRQCGKSTLAKRLLSPRGRAIHLDLERPRDLLKLEDAEWFFTAHRGKLICLDEIQRCPELFPVIRSLVDDWGGNGHFLVLGSASRDLLKQSSESLAGRIAYLRLTPFLWSEVVRRTSQETYLARGAFPRSLLAKSDAVSFRWRENFISTFLERDLLQWAGVSPIGMRRLLQMLAHRNGQTANYSAMASSLGVSGVTVKNHVDLLTSTYMLETVPPYLSNLGKRLVKSPKIYVADSGLAAALLNITSFDEWQGHPGLGAAWEQVVLVTLKGAVPRAEVFFYRSTQGAEMDFVVTLGRKVVAVECKCSLAPSLTKGAAFALEDIRPLKTFVVAPVKEGWAMKPGVDVVSLSELPGRVQAALA